jgi:hypothetical protein
MSLRPKVCRNQLVGYGLLFRKFTIQAIGNTSLRTYFSKKSLAEMTKYFVNEPMNYLKLMLRVWVFCLGASMITAVLLSNQFRSSFPGELFMIFFWSVLFAFGLAFILPVAPILFSRLPIILSYVLAILLGIFAGYVYDLSIHLLFINPMFGDFSIPVFFNWVAGGIAGLVSVAGLGSREGKGHLLFEFFVSLIFVVLIGWGSKPFVDNIFETRSVHISWIKWVPGSEELVLDPFIPKQLTTNELNMIKSAGLKGQLEWHGGIRVEMAQSAVS